MEVSQNRINAEDFKERHRRDEKAFTRERSLSFALVLVLLIRNGVKSLQNIVNEAMTWLERPTVSASALSQARYKLKHTAFIELNQAAIVDTLYGDEDYLRFWGFRVLAIDGSKFVLSDNTAIREAFGTIAWRSGKDSEIQGERPYALASVMYDVLNRVALESVD